MARAVGLRAVQSYIIEGGLRATLINLTLISIALCICSFHYANTGKMQ